MLKHLSSITTLLVILINPLLASSLPQTPLLEERVKETILPNGLSVVVVERQSAPVFFSLITFRVGSCQEQPNRTGLSHFLEHMLFKGSKNIGTTNYKSEIPIMNQLEELAGKIRDKQNVMTAWRYDTFEEYATQIKASLPQETRERIGSDEAAGWREVLNILPTDTSKLPIEWRNTPWMLADRNGDYWKMFREMISMRVNVAELLASHKRYISDSEALDAIYDMHGSAMHNAFTTPDQTTYMVGLPSNCLELYMFLESDRFQNPVFREFYSEREVVMEELRLGENDPEDVLYKNFLSTTFTAHPYGRPIIGWMSDIRSTLRTDMENHFYRYYAPNNCQITIVGDVKADEVFRLVKKYFGSWKSADVAHEVSMIEPEQIGERRVTIEFDAEPSMMIGWHVPVAPHPDSYPLMILDNILSHGATSRFYRNIFISKGLTASPPGAWRAPANRYPNIFVVSVTPKSPHSLEEVEQVIYEEIDRLKNELVTERELERARNRYRASELGRLRSNQALAFTLSSAFVNRGDWRSVTDDFERLMAVTPEDIMRVAQKYFVQQNRTVTYLVKKNGNDQMRTNLEIQQ